jgi:hypothetical protein
LEENVMATARFRFCLMALAAVPSTAMAVTLLVSPPLKAGAGGIVCRVFNGGTKPIELTSFSAAISAGGFGATGCDAGDTLFPQRGCEHVPLVGSACTAQPCVCRLSFTGSKKGVRANPVSRDAAGDAMSVDLR